MDKKKWCEKIMNFKDCLTWEKESRKKEDEFFKIDNCSATRWEGCW